MEVVSGGDKACLSPENSPGRMGREEEEEGEEEQDSGQLDG